MAAIPQGQPYVEPYVLVSASDHETGLTGATPIVLIKKAGGSFASPQGAVTESGNGWYQIALTATDTNTLGALSFHITATGADATDFVEQIVSSQIGPAPSGLGGQTSGDYSANLVATEIITFALRKMGVINDEETPTAAMYQEGLASLNDLVAELQATGIHIWTNEEGILFLQQGQNRYLIGGSSADHWADAFSYSLTTLSASGAAGDTSVSLTSPTILPVPFAENQNIGISLDDGSAFWTTISGLPSGGVAPIADALPSSASAGNFTYAYAETIQRPLKIPSARRLVFQGMSEVPFVRMMAREDFMNLPNKLTPGLVNQGYYNPAREVGEFYTWNLPQDVSCAIRFTYQRPIQGFTSPVNAADVPREWMSALKWNLAKEMGMSYSISAMRWQIILAEAAAKLDVLSSFDREPESILFGRSQDQTRR